MLGVTENDLYDFFGLRSKGIFKKHAKLIFLYPKEQADLEDTRF